MKMHLLNCATMCPVGGRLLTGKPGRARMTANCLLLETDAGLVLVDSGIGTADIAAPKERLSFFMRRVVRPVLDAGEAAVARVRALGFAPEDVRHIVLTHLDSDHAGGLPDFPWARVHVLAEERAAVEAIRTMTDRARYSPAQWAHGPDWSLRPASGGGEPWFGFEAVRDLDGLPPEILMVPLIGHSLGHAGIAVRGEAGWILHCGDAYYLNVQLEGPDATPALLRRVHASTAVDPSACAENIARLAQLRRDHGGEVRLLSAHDPADLTAPPA